MSTLKVLVQNAVNERLAAFKGNQSQASKSLGITRSTLRKYMDKSKYTRVSKNNIFINYTAEL